MRHMWQGFDRYVSKRIWDVDIASAGRAKTGFIKSLRLVYLVVRDLLDGQLSMRAMSLVYTTMLSLVPLLAVTFSVLKAFGVHNQVEPTLRNLLAALGPKGLEISQRVIEFVENTKVGVLGAIGLALLIYFVVSLVQKIEANLNYIWHVAQPRGLAQRFSEYISVILVGPVLVFSALSLTVSIENTALVQRLLTVDAISTVAYVVGRLIPYVLVCIAFTFFYVFIPNTRVNPTSALVGGTTAGILWETVGWLFASFVATSAKYAAIYSSFAVLVLFMIWLYVSWYIVLIGAQIAYYHQHPQTPTWRRDRLRLLMGSMRERLTMLIMGLIGYHHYYHKPYWTTEDLASYLEIDAQAVQAVIDHLVDAGFLVQTAAESPGYVPAQDIENISLKALLDSARGSSKIIHLEEVTTPVPHVDEVMDSIDAGISDALGTQTLKSLVLASQAPSQSAPSPVSATVERKTVG
jgi:membrane protein